MWTFAFFDLPVVKKKDRKAYAIFRKDLLAIGFTMLQFSVYARYTPTKEGMESVHRKVKEILPPKGEVRLLSVTDRQFAKMGVFIGEKKEEPEKPPEQLLLF